MLKQHGLTCQEINDAQSTKYFFNRNNDYPLPIISNVIGSETRVPVHSLPVQISKQYRRWKVNRSQLLFIWKRYYTAHIIHSLNNSFPFRSFVGLSRSNRRALETFPLCCLLPSRLTSVLNIRFLQSRIKFYIKDVQKSCWNASIFDK